MSELLPALIADPGCPPRGSVIWLHGLGDSGYGFASVLQHLPLERLGLRVVLPHAPEQPVTINGGMEMPAWYDIRPTDGPERHDEVGIRASAAAIDALIARERSLVPAARIALVGFSQGGAMALHCGLRASEGLAGIAALSTYLLLPEETARERDPANASTPIFWGHGTQDEMVSPARGAAARAWLAAQGYACEAHDYPMGHEVCLPELRHLGAWFEARFAD